MTFQETGLKGHSNRILGFKMTNLQTITNRYKQNVTSCLDTLEHPNVVALADRLVTCIKKKQRLFVCGNGGSGSNASHIENDLTLWRVKNAW